jgi:hypothetical protein
MLVYFSVEFVLGYSKQGLQSFELDMEVTADNLVGDAGRSQPQRQRMRFRQAPERRFVSIDVVGRHRLIIGDRCVNGLSNLLLAANRQVAHRRTDA